MINKKILLLVVITIVISIFTRFHNLHNFYSETDDHLSIAQLLNYDKLDLYDIANDRKSPSYNGPLKSYLRELQLKKSSLIDNSQLYISNILFNLTPSKHSTLAPLQYLLFGWMLNEEQNYNNLKFYSRIPSAIFSILTIFITYLLSKKIFKRDNYFLFLPSLLLVYSYPIILVSQRSYNYSAAVFGITLLFYLFLKETVSSNNSKLFISKAKLGFKKNFYFSLILALTSYLTYISIVLMPVFFIFKFIKDFFKEKKLLTTSNYNLIICGVMYSVIILPLLYYMFALEINTRGMSASTGGNNWEYSIIGNENNYMKFFLLNLYLIVVKNLSFFLDNFIGANIMQTFIFFITLIGMFFVFHNNTQNNYKVLLYLFFLIMVYWLLLVSLNITALGPTRHLLIFTPVIAIMFTYGLKIINKFIFKTEKFFSISIILSMTLIFFLNYSNFLYFYKDVFNEKSFNNLVKKYNIQYIANDGSFANNLCLMPSINISIKSCPIRNDRHLNPDRNTKELNQNIYKDVKKNSGSILFVNYDINEKIQLDLINNGYKQILTVKKIKFTNNDSPLFISKFTPNSLELVIYN
tara:strand:+ start:2794 stop:4533 length:1740 start_codon:yes stop_codon:yes gene_type:complete